MCSANVASNSEIPKTNQQICDLTNVVRINLDLMDHLHWRRLRNNAGDSDSHYLLGLATLSVVT